MTLYKVHQRWGIPTKGIHNCIVTTIIPTTIKPSWANRAAAVSTPVHFRDRAGIISTATDYDQSDNPYTEKQ